MIQGQLASILSNQYRRMQTIVNKVWIRLSKRRIIVLTGCGRSGTTFSATLLHECGLKIGHERLAIDGISSWMLVSSKRKVLLGPSCDDLNGLDKVVVHQVREPLLAISSMLAVGRLSWRMIADEIPIDLAHDSKTLRAMKYYYYWNLKAERISDHRIRVESFKDEIRPILINGGFAFIDKLDKIDGEKRVNSRKHKMLSWEDLEREDLALSKKIKELAIRYGYSF